MATQDELNEKVGRLEAAVGSIQTAVTTEAAEIKTALEAIKENNDDDLDLSGLDAVIAKVEGLSSTVSGIYTAEAPAEGSTTEEVPTEASNEPVAETVES